MRQNFFKQPQSLSKNRPYIVPTIYGFAFAMCCLVILLMGFLFLNNLVYLICFLMVGFATSSLVQTNRNIENAEILKWEMSTSFEGEKKELLLNLKNAGENSIQKLILEYRKRIVEVDEIKPFETARLRVECPADELGRHSFDRLQLKSSYPFDLSLSWKNLKLANEYYVFPRPEGVGIHTILQESRTSQELERENFQGHHRYSASDNPKSIDWKAYSRTRMMMVKEFDSPQELNIHIKSSYCRSTDPTTRKRQLSKWITECEKQNYFYSLELTESTFDFGRGPEHYLICMKAIVDEKV